MVRSAFPEKIMNWIQGEEYPARSGNWFAKQSPVNGTELCRVARSGVEDVELAVQSARQAQAAWSDIPGVERGALLHALAMQMEVHREEIAATVAAETGKSFQEAYGETGGAIDLGRFFAGEGQRLYGRTTTSGTPNKYAMTIRQPIGIAGLIIAANTPIANAAWKIFPALICGNTAILKGAEDTPATTWLLGKLALEAGLPKGVLNILQGYGQEAGAPLVANPEVGVISFTGSTEVGRQIQTVAGQRFARVSLELGGKNALVVCDDADLEKAARWVLLSAFSNAGQRCAAASRIIIFDAVYDRFREMLVTKTQKLRVGPSDRDDLGPLINESPLNRILKTIEGARSRGAVILTGGKQITDPEHMKGFFMEPTLIEEVDPRDEISRTELFGPVACLYRVPDLQAALNLSNDSPYGLTACIHTRSLHRAIYYTRKVRTGVAVVNAGTYGSEPHMPFGGMKQSGNGSREPGTEALDVYSSLKDLYIQIDPEEI